MGKGSSCVTVDVPQSTRLVAGFGPVCVAAVGSVLVGTVVVAVLLGGGGGGGVAVCCCDGCMWR